MFMRMGLSDLMGIGMMIVGSDNLDLTQWGFIQLTI